MPASQLHHHTAWSLLVLLFVTLAIAPPALRATTSEERPPTDPRVSDLVREAAAAGPALAALPDAALRISPAGEVGVEVRVSGSPGAAAAAMAELGVRVGAWSPAAPLVAAWLRPEQIDGLAALPMVERVEPMLAPQRRAGGIATAGDTVLRTAEARALFGLSGKGVRIGVISDGLDDPYTAHNELSTSQTRGELPALCTLPLTGATPACVAIDPNNPGSGSEGVAMLEIIHDLAPGAVLGFSSGVSSGVPAFLQAVDYLEQTFQADVIVDDVGYLTEPYFEDGPIALRAQQAVDRGVVFVSAAGNDARSHYQAPLALPTGCPTGTRLQCLHRFSATDTSQSFVLTPGAQIVVVLQWSNPFSNTLSAAQKLDDLDLYLLNESGTVLRSAAANQQVTRQPLEVLSYGNASASSVRVNLVVDAYALRSSTVPTIEMQFSVQNLAEYLGAADSVYGHPAAAGVIAAGAVAAATPSQLATYSSQGPVTIAQPKVETRQKPELVATDCVATSVVGFTNFCGTSASSAHLAGVAGLLVELEPLVSPARVRSLLTASAVDLGVAGVDNLYGAGRADMVAAAQASIISRDKYRLYAPLARR